MLSVPPSSKYSHKIEIYLFSNYCTWTLNTPSFCCVFVFLPALVYKLAWIPFPLSDRYPLCKKNQHHNIEARWIYCFPHSLRNRKSDTSNVSCQDVFTPKGIAFHPSESKKYPFAQWRNMFHLDGVGGK